MPIASWHKIDAATFGLGAGVAGLAGVASSQLTNVGRNLGQACISVTLLGKYLCYALLAFFHNQMGCGGNNGLTDFKDLQ